MLITTSARIGLVGSLIAIACLPLIATTTPRWEPQPTKGSILREDIYDLPAPSETLPRNRPSARSPRGEARRGPFVSVQINTDEFGQNIIGDAANEPSIAVDPTNPQRIVVGWRQFDSVASSFRQAGWAFSHDAGRSWTFPGVLQPGVFGSDPVLGADAEGNFYYYSLKTNPFRCDLFKSVDAGVSWLAPVPAFGGDKAWMEIDNISANGKGNIYCTWTSHEFTRSTDGGLTFIEPVPMPSGEWGTIAVGPSGEVYTAGGLRLDHCCQIYKCAIP